MALNSVNIKVLSQTQPLLPSDEYGVLGLVVGGVAGNHILMSNPRKITSKADYDGMDLTKGGTVNFWQDKFIRQVLKYTSNIRLIMVPNADTYATYLSDTNKTKAGYKLLETYDDINIMGLFKDSISTTKGSVDKCVPKAVHDLIANCQKVGKTWEEKGKPFVSCVYSNIFDKAEISNLTDYTQKDEHLVSCIIGKSAEFATMLGMLSQIPVQRKISRVLNGPMLGVSVNDLTADILENNVAINDKGYIVARTFTGRQGVYFASDRTLAKTTNVFDSISRNRVIQKALRIVHILMEGKIGQDVLANPNGTISPSAASSIEAEISQELVVRMLNDGQISDFGFSVNRTNDIVTSGELKVNLTLHSVGHFEKVSFELGYKK